MTTAAPFPPVIYEAAFVKERSQVYPAIDAYERECGFAIDQEALLTAARVLSCPVKANPPNWQHGRVIYSATRRYLRDAPGPVRLLDIGTAKGFSALCLQWALRDAGALGHVVSVDVIDPFDAIPRNTVAECDGPQPLAAILAPWPETRAIEFVRSTGRAWLTGHPERVHVAVVDGKHTYDAVSWEAALLAARQQTGDLIVFDDLQIQGVLRAVEELRGYAVECLAALPTRRYAIARKR